MHKFAGTHLYTWVERGSVRVKCLAQTHNIMTGPRNAEANALAIGPSRLHEKKYDNLVTYRASKEVPYSVIFSFNHSA